MCPSAREKRKQLFDTGVIPSVLCVMSWKALSPVVRCAEECEHFCLCLDGESLVYVVVLCQTALPEL